MCVSFLTFFQKQKISKFQKKKLNFEKPKTPCFGRKVAATGGGGSVHGGTLEFRSAEYACAPCTSVTAFSFLLHAAQGKASTELGDKLPAPTTGPSSAHSAYNKAGDSRKQQTSLQASEERVQNVIQIQ